MNRLFHFSELGSTQDEMRERFNRGELQAGDTLITDHQTAGHGRFGRVWESPARSCVTMSVAVPLPKEIDPSALSLIAGVACLETLKAELGVECALKWPNDIILSERKIAGIISEHLGEQNGLVFCSVGAGINLFQTSDQLPERPVFPAASLQTLGALPPGADFASLRDRISAKFLAELTARASRYAASQIVLY